MIKRTEKPILFSTAMIQRILDTDPARRKTQTRRLMRPQPVPIPEIAQYVGDSDWWWSCAAVQSMVGLNDEALSHLSPYGSPGGRLWVRETHAIVPNTAYFSSTDDGVHPLPHRVSPDGMSWAVYRAGWIACKPGRWRPSIHMPRWASRILLDIKSSRAERLQDISVEDIIAESFSTKLREHDAVCDLRDQFAAAWDALNGKRPGASWAANPWVWAIDFEVADDN